MKVALLELMHLVEHVMIVPSNYVLIVWMNLLALFARMPTY